MKALCLPEQRFILVTLHRPGNVDEEEGLSDLLSFLCDLAKDWPVIFPVHPRTRARLKRLSWSGTDWVRLVDPMNYIDFLAVMHASAVVLTDSGGIQEETTYLGIPCFTLRPNTERPVTTSLGTNTLIHKPYLSNRETIGQAMDMPRKKVDIPLWDGHAACRMVEGLRQYL